MNKQFIGGPLDGGMTDDADPHLAIYIAPERLAHYRRDDNVYTYVEMLSQNDLEIVGGETGD